MSVTKLPSVETLVDKLAEKDIDKLKEKFKIEGTISQFEDIKKIKKQDKCCILGFAPSWNEAPYKEKGIDFWGINELYIYLHKHKITTPFAAWFEVHDIEKSPSKQKPQHQEFLKNCKISLVTLKHWDKYPSSIAYPVQYVVDYFNTNFVIDEKNTGFNDYSNQISWMIALAIVLGYKEIMVYGVDMAQESEYAFQRASCQFFLGYAIGQGIKVRVPKSCELLKAAKLYGFESDNTNRHRKKKRIESCNQSLEQIDIRNSEIVYFKEKIDKTLNNQLVILESDMEMLNKAEIEKKMSIVVAKELINFFENMPTTLEEIQKGKEKLLKLNTESLARVEKELENISKNKKKIEKKKDRLQADAYINKALLDEEFNVNEQSKNKVLGSIGECKHDLNNNLV